MIHCAVRWKSMSFATRSTSVETICTAVEPVPTMPMRRPSSGTSWSQRAGAPGVGVRAPRPAEPMGLRVDDHGGERRFPELGGGEDARHSRADDRDSDFTHGRRHITGLVEMNSLYAQIFAGFLR